ncbi:MAG: DUF3179 domain-containing protein [Rhodospirillaceae bacterium]|nr:DUF3179 domain-containing protein [Rhodospirillaceae bacterium]
MDIRSARLHLAALVVAIGAIGFASTLSIIPSAIAPALAANVEAWRTEWPKTDFAKHSIDLDEIFSGGPPKDGIPSIDNPEFKPLAAVEIADSEPVIGLVLGGKAKAYPLRVLTWHEIVNDVVAGVPVTVTYCPLCNSAIAFDRRLGDRVLDFGTTGRLRNSDMVMYDRQTESWWQQFLGEAIVGELTGQTLKTIPARLESYGNFKARHPNGSVLVPNNEHMRPYGANPYVGYDSSQYPFLYNGSMPEGIPPLARVITVGDKAWSLSLLRKQERIVDGDLVLSWTPGQNSALDARVIAKGKDVGNVVVQRAGTDVVYDVTFAFVFHAFRPKGQLIIK